MIQPDLKVSSKPPLGGTNVLSKKRHSLHAVEPLKKLEYLARRGSLEYIQKEESRSWGNLRLLDSKSRSASLAQLKTSGRTLSASNLAALSDSNLSIQVALPQRSYDYSGSESNLVKQSFEVVVKRYYEQLTVGCGNLNCWNKFCASNVSTPKLNSRHASFVSTELATLGKEYFCIENPQKVGKAVIPLSLTDKQKSISSPNEHETSSLDNKHKSTSLSKEHKQISVAGEQKPVSFLQKFFSTTPFNFLFSNETTLKPNKKQRPGLLSDLKKTLGMSGSESSIKLNSNNGGPFGEKHSIALKSAVANTKVTLDSTEKGVMYDKATSPTLIDLQNDIETVDIGGTDLEEFEDQCVLEMSSSNIKELSLTHLTLPMLETSVENYRQCGDASFIINTIRTVFSSPEALNASFKMSASKNKLSKFEQSNGSSERIMSKDKHYKLDIPAVKSAYKLLLDLKPKDVFIQPLQNSAEIHLKTLQTCQVEPLEVFQLVILLENPLVLENYDLLQTFCGVVSNLETKTRDAFMEVLLEYDNRSFQRVLKAVQKLLSSQVHKNQCSEPHLITICIMLSTLHQANQMSENRGRALVDISEFYNHELSQKLDYKLEYEKWGIQSKNPSQSVSCGTASNLSILDFPFVLEPASKVRLMHIHAMWQMGLQYCDAMVYQAKVHQAKRVYENDDDIAVEDSVKSAMSPFLVLDVRRDHLIEDTLVQVRLKENDLKKALKIRYVGGGEEGLDLGGLQKEFFHIIVHDIIQPATHANEVIKSKVHQANMSEVKDETLRIELFLSLTDYGMFTYLEEVERMWINCDSLESDLLFELVGTLLGIAIYNGIILDLHFPPVVYKKLQGFETNLNDLKDVEPSLTRSLQSLLEYDGDVENTFCYTFQISRTIFDETRVINLKVNGEDTAVTNENRTEFVQLYVDYLLNTSIARQFDALSRGFHKVCDVTCLNLFHPEELELLICGSSQIDFTSIEESSTYDNGFSKTHPTILAFWDIVRNMNESEMKCLLSFVTGNDRVPLEGLSNVTFQIIKQGEDSDKLPTAFTCFNKLMLPEYSSKEKLRDRLFLAIQNSKGFGLI